PEPTRKELFMMLKKTYLLFSLTVAAFLLSTLAMYSKTGAQDVQKDEGYYIEMGMGYFNKGYYDVLPKNRKDEASLYLEHAITAFKKAIAINKDCVQAHRNLARVYYVQKRYVEAAEQYQNVTDLSPSDIDTYVITALAYTKAQRYAEAIERLNIAKTFTADEAVIQKLDDYINKIEEEKRLR
ncbi:MAG: tetratricopeptide repeat protein, partial [Deltaproteobacteria bacterium]|nr:tetratricopeptide repeat protein [Deltaproteobacteria bacterium]